MIRYDVEALDSENYVRVFFWYVVCNILDVLVLNMGEFQSWV